MEVIKANKTHQFYTLNLMNYPELAYIHNSFHTSLLKKYTPNDPKKYPSREQTKPEATNKSKQEFQMEKALEFRTKPGIQGKVKQYKLKWRGWEPQYDSWVDKHNITTLEIMEEFWRRGSMHATYKNR